MAHDVVVGPPFVPVPRSKKSWAWRGLPLCRNEETLGSGVSPHQFLDGVHASGTLMWVVSLPVQLSHRAEGSIGVLAVIGVVLWAVGLYFEVVGDIQLSRFKADPANQGKVLDTGLWRYTRHPNYFGDACCGGELRSSHARSVLACGGSLVPL